MACMLSVAACGKKHKLDLTVIPDVTEETAEVSDITPNPAYVGKDPIQVIFTMTSLDDTTVEEFVAGLQAQNPYTEYAVYDDAHYSAMVSFADYAQQHQNVNDTDYVDNVVRNLLTNEAYGGAFVSIEYDEKFQDISLYVNREIFDANRDLYIYGSLYSMVMFSDICQAYNGIAPDAREFNLTYIDSATGQAIETQ